MSNTLTAFDDSQRRSFVGSPKLARNQFTSNLIARYAYGNGMEFVDGHVPVEYVSLSRYDRVIFPRSVFEWMRVGQLGDYTIGDTNSNGYITLAQGWNRITFIVWGIFGLTNPFVSPRSMDVTYPPTPSNPNPRTVTAYDDNQEIRLTDFTQGAGNPSRIVENVPIYFTHEFNRISTIPQRIVLNQVRIASAEHDPWKIWRVERSISFSMLQSSSQSTRWFWPAPSFTQFLTMFVDQRAQFPGFPSTIIGLVSQLPNFSGLDPVSPVSIAPFFRYYDGISQNQAFKRTEKSPVISWVPVSVIRQSEYRPVEITDFVMQEVPGGP